VQQQTLSGSKLLRWLLVGVQPKVDDAAMVDAIMRYNYYKELGIDLRHIAPYQESWLGNALAMVPAEPPPNVGQVTIRAAFSRSPNCHD
jgi:hypothetical protein